MWQEPKHNFGLKEKVSESNMDQAMEKMSLTQVAELESDNRLLQQLQERSILQRLLL